jgi:hypothetical protein
MPKNTHRKEIEMKKVLTVFLVSIPSLLLCALIVFGVFLMKVPVTQKSIDMLEKGMTFAEVFEVLKSDIIITPISEEDVEKIKHEFYPYHYNGAINYLGDDYETSSWRQYTIYEWQMENEDSFMIFYGRGTGNNDRAAVRLFITRSEWQRVRNEGREFDESNENIKMEYIYVGAVNEYGLIASLGDKDSVFIEYENADKFFSTFCSLAVYYDEGAIKEENGYIYDLNMDDRINYLYKVRAVSIRFTNPQKGEPMFG